MFFILYLLGPIEHALSARSRIAAHFFSWLFMHTRRKFTRKYERYGLIALCIFVAIPLPGTGVWTGSVAAWLFDIKKVSAMLAIAVGALIAGIVVTIATVGVSFVL